MSGSNTGAPRVALPAPSGALAAKAARSTVGNAILVNKSQRGNTALEHIKGVPWEYSSEILADYQVGSTTGVLFLSLKYHHLHTQYIFTRFEKLGRNYDLRILLILCDVTEHQGSIKELTKACLLNNMTVVVAWSPEEVGQYLATYKLYEFKSHQLIKERVDADYSSILRAALTTVRGVNKTDVMTLRTNFGSFSNIVHATTEDMQLCPGFGPTKVRRLREAFNKPFYSTGQKPLGIRTDPITSAIMGADVGAAEPDLPIPDDAPRNTLATGNISAPSPSRTHRHSSPEWDIESTPPLPLADATLDLALDLNPSDEDMPVGQGTSAIPDQDESLYEVAGPSAPKKRRADN